MIKTSQQHFNRTIQIIRDTEKQIAAKPNASFVANYRKHIASLETLLSELSVCNALSSGELIASSEAVFVRMQQLNAVTA